MSTSAPTTWSVPRREIDLNPTLRVGTMTFLLLGTFAGRVITKSTFVLGVSTAGALTALAIMPLRQRSLRISLPCVMAIAWVSSTVLWSIHPGTTMRRALSFALTAMAASLLGAIGGAGEVRNALRLACKITVVASLMLAAAAPGWAITPPGQNAPGLQGVALQKNQLGFIICLGLAAEGLMPPSKSRKFWFFLYFVAVLLTQSSTAIAVAFLAIALLGVVASVSKIHDRWARTLFVIVSVAPGVILVMLVFIDPALLTGLFGKDPTLTGRSDIWAVVLEAVRARPLLGYGWNTVWPTGNSNFYPSTIAFEVVRRVRFPVINAHNGFLDLMLGAGIVGLALFLSLTVAALGRAPLRRENAWRAAVVLTFALDSFSESNYNLGFVAILFAMASARGERRSTSSLIAADDVLMDGGEVEQKGRWYVDGGIDAEKDV